MPLVCCVLVYEAAAKKFNYPEKKSRQARMVVWFELKLASFQAAKTTTFLDTRFWTMTYPAAGQGLHLCAALLRCPSSMPSLMELLNLLGNGRNLIQ